MRLLRVSLHRTRLRSKDQLKLELELEDPRNMAGGNLPTNGRKRSRAVMNDCTTQQDGKSCKEQSPEEKVRLLKFQTFAGLLDLPFGSTD